MKFLHRFAIAHPLPTLLVALLALAAVVPGVLKLRLRTDGHALVPTDSAEVRFDARVRADFGVRDLMIVLIRTNGPQGIYNLHTLALVDSLSRALATIPGLDPSTITSLATEPGQRARPGTLLYMPLLEPLPEKAADLDRVRDEVDALRLFSGTLVSFDRSATAIFVGTPPGADRLALYLRLRDLADAQALENETIDILGAPVAEAQLGSHILADLGVPRRWLGLREGHIEAPPSGRPHSLHELRSWIAVHIGLAPLTVLILAAVFLIAFRRPGAALVPLIEMGAALLFVFGLMGWTGVPVYLTIAVLPIILTSTGVADEVHIFRRYVETLRNRPELSERAALRETMDELHSAIIQTSITTAVGFASFAFSTIAPIWAFGVFTAVGTLFCLLWTITAMPALVALMPRRWMAAIAPRDSRRVFAPAAGTLGGAETLVADRPHKSGWAALLIRLRWPIVLAPLIFFVVAPLGVKRLVVQDSWINGFAPESRFRRATEFFNRQFLGTHVLMCVVDAAAPKLRGTLRAADIGVQTIALPVQAGGADARQLSGAIVRVYRAGADGRPLPSKYNSPQVWESYVESIDSAEGRLQLRTPPQHQSAAAILKLADDEAVQFEIESIPFIRPSLLRSLGEFEDFVRRQGQDAVGGVLGPTDYLTTTNFIVEQHGAAGRRVPDEPDRIRWLWSQYERIRGAGRLRQAVDADMRRGVITVFLRDANFVDTAALMRSIRDYERQTLAPLGVRLDFAGDVAVSQTLIGAIVRTQTGSILASLLGIVAITALMGRSLRWGLFCLVPCGLAVLASFATMGWTGIPLGVATSIFSGMILGVGVDYAIHMLERFKLARRGGLNIDDAVADVVRHSSPAVLTDGLGITLGFGVMMLSQVPANVYLGGLVAVSMLTCLLATLVLLPALLRIAGR